MPSLGGRVLEGERNAISRAISIIENGNKDSLDLIRKLYPHTGKAYVIGVTGPLGTGKSSLVDRLIKAYRGRGKSVAVLAVDPSSPISGGAILGDRVRMLEHSLDSGVFIRSMASRGDEGGLSKSARNAVRVLDAAGYEIIFVETVGIGQTEAEIVRVAETVLVVLMPELGDEIQTAKAGLMEIGDIFALNKSDLPGADKLLYNVESVLASREGGWQQVAIKVSAKSGEGVESLMKAFDAHHEFLTKSNFLESRAKQNLGEELIETVTDSVSGDLKEMLLEDSTFNLLIERLEKRETDPASAAELLRRKYIVNRTDSSDLNMGK